MTIGTNWTAIVDVGASFTQQFFYQIGLRAVDIAGFSAVFRFRLSSGAIAVVVDSETPAASVLQIDPGLGKLYLSCAPRDTALLAGARGSYELELYSTGGVIDRLIDGPSIFRQPGRPMVDPVYVVIRRDTRAVTVERSVVDAVRIVDRGPPGARGIPGAPGPTGSIGPQGPPGVGTVSGATATTTSTTATPIQIIALTPDSTFRYEGSTSASSSGAEQFVREIVTGSVDEAGVVTLNVPRIEYVDTDVLGSIGFMAGPNQLIKQATASSATSTFWSPSGQLTTVN